MGGSSRKRSKSASSRRKAALQETDAGRKSSRRSGEDQSSGGRHGGPRDRWSSRGRPEGSPADPQLYERLLHESRSGRGPGRPSLEGYLDEVAARSRRRLMAMTHGGLEPEARSLGSDPGRPVAQQTPAQVVPRSAPQFAPSRSYAQRTEAAAPPQQGSSPEPVPARPAKPKGRVSKAAGEAPKSDAVPLPLVQGLPDSPPISTELTLDPWQRKAFDLLLSGHHVVVDAPTSAGKTRVIEALLDAKMGEGLRLIYTSPVKSLSNDKYRDFAQRYGKDRVGINTGDFKENLGAPIILATLETYRNSLLGLEPDMSRRVVVYDEYHYLQDESRGSAWEESIILTPKGAQLILLSASVPNAEEFATWIQGITGRSTEVVRVERRPVPLVDVVHTARGWVLADDLALTAKELELLATTYTAERRRMRRQPRDRRFYAELLGEVVEALQLDLGPLIVYAARRAEVETLATAMVKVLGRSASTPWNPKAEAALKERIDHLPGWEYVPQELQSMVLRHGVAYHHSGMIPPARVAIESLLKEGLLRVCMGTMGISLGVNFAVRSAFIADESRPGESGEKAYSNSEILQMLGRAGRRGHDVQGFSLWSDLGKFARFRPRERERCVSSLKFDPSTVLGLVDRTGNYALLAEFYKKSLFMQGQPSSRVLVFDHVVLSAEVYQATGGAVQACQAIPETFLLSESGKRRSSVPCGACPSRTTCHNLARQSRTSLLQQIVGHLEEVGALRDQRLTDLGRFARHFPQSGGLLIASWLASGAMNGESFGAYIQAMAVFCSAHFKEIPPLFVDRGFLSKLRIDTEIEFYYPSDLFPEYYDEVKGRLDEFASPLAFRELNFGAPSIVQAWLDPKTSWESLVERHATRFFSAGDCMMVLFRFATYLQSCARLREHDRKLADEARRLLSVVLREPLDARNRMLMEEVEDEERIEPEVAEAVDAAAAEFAEAVDTSAGQPQS